MNEFDTTEDDANLISKANHIIDIMFKPGRHRVASAIRCDNGKIYSGIHLDSAGIDICAEAIALGNAIINGESSFITIVAVGIDDNGNHIILPPCGTCRELLANFAPNIDIILAKEVETIKVPLCDLLPLSYTKSLNYRPLSRK